MTRKELLNIVSENLPDNANNEITASDLRNVIRPIITSNINASIAPFNIDISNLPDIMGAIFTFNGLANISPDDRFRYMIVPDYLVRKFDRKSIRGRTGDYTSVNERRWRCSMQSSSLSPAVISGGAMLSEKSDSNCQLSISTANLGNLRFAKSLINGLPHGRAYIGADHSTPSGIRGSALYSGGSKRRANAKAPLAVVFIRAAIIRYIGNSSRPTLHQFAGGYERVFISDPVAITVSSNVNNDVIIRGFMRMQSVPM